MTSARSFRFQRVYVEITNICNLRCDFCAGTTRPPASMDPEFFRRILDQLAPLTDQVCDFTDSGSPTPRFQGAFGQRKTIRCLSSRYPLFHHQLLK